MPLFTVLQEVFLHDVRLGLQQGLFELKEERRGNTMKRWEVYQEGKRFEGVQARDHSEAVLEALRKLDLDDESGLDVRLAAQ